MRKLIIPVVLCMAVLLTACGGDKAKETSALSGSADTETSAQQAETGTSAEQEAAQKEQPSAENDMEGKTAAVLTEEQAYAAVINYNKAIGSGYDEEMNSEGYSEYWNVTTNEDGQIVVLYRSYTAAQIRYYIDPASGETYVTELVPGIIDEEQKTGETFNAWDYLTE